LMLVFSYRTDDLMTTPLWTGATSVILQTFGISLLIANTLNMASHADNAFSKKLETQPLTAGEAA
jgi:branched-subunit amino acid ABC-type transport system permease component